MKKVLFAAIFLTFFYSKASFASEYGYATITDLKEALYYLIKDYDELNRDYKKLQKDYAQIKQEIYTLKEKKVINVEIKDVVFKCKMKEDEIDKEIEEFVKDYR